MILVKITKADESDKKYGVHDGDVFKAHSYFLDPHDKWTLIQKVSGSDHKYEPRSRNLYKSQGEIIKQTKLKS